VDSPPNCGLAAGTGVGTEITGPEDSWHAASDRGLQLIAEQEQACLEEVGQLEVGMEDSGREDRAPLLHGDDAASPSLAGDFEAMDDDNKPPASLKGLILSPLVFRFLALVTLMGTAVGVIDGYLFLYLDELGGSETLMGTCLTFTCLVEVPVFFFSSHILNALGVDGTLHLVMAAFVVRLLAYSTLLYWPSPWLVLPVELLHGITFGCAWAAGTEKCAILAPATLRATMVGMFQSAYFGLGRGLGALLGGLIYGSHGGPVMFRCAFLWMATGWAAHVLASWVLSRAHWGPVRGIRSHGISGRDATADAVL